MHVKVIINPTVEPRLGISMNQKTTELSTEQVNKYTDMQYDPSFVHSIHKYYRQ